MENIYVFDDGVIRGFIEMNGTQLSKIYVDSFFQSQGVGDALIRYATEEFGADNLWADQVKAQIISGELKEDDNLPSVRTLSKELRISALTVKKAYDSLEQEGFTVTIHGKGTYVAAANKEMMMEEYRREVEEELTEVIRKAKRYGLSEEDIREMLELILEG